MWPECWDSPLSLTCGWTDEIPTESHMWPDWWDSPLDLKCGQTAEIPHWASRVAGLMRSPLSLTCDQTGEISHWVSTCVQTGQDKKEQFSAHFCRSILLQHSTTWEGAICARKKINNCTPTKSTAHLLLYTPLQSTIIYIYKERESTVWTCLLI